MIRITYLSFSSYSSFSNRFWNSPVATSWLIWSRSHFFRHHLSWLRQSSFLDRILLKMAAPQHHYFPFAFQIISPSFSLIFLFQSISTQSEFENCAKQMKVKWSASLSFTTIILTSINSSVLFILTFQFGFEAFRSLLLVTLALPVDRCVRCSHVIGNAWSFFSCRSIVFDLIENKIKRMMMMMISMMLLLTSSGLLFLRYSIARFRAIVFRLHAGSAHFRLPSLFSPESTAKRFCRHLTLRFDRKRSPFFFKSKQCKHW